MQRNDNNSNNNNHTDATSFFTLPEHIWGDTLSHLNKVDSSSFFNARVVCKQWQKIIDNLEPATERWQLGMLISKYIHSCKVHDPNQAYKEKIEKLAAMLVSKHMQALTDYSSLSFKREFELRDLSPESEKEAELRTDKQLSIALKFRDIFLLILEVNHVLLNKLKLPPNCAISPTLKDLYYATDFECVFALDASDPLDATRWKNVALRFDYWIIENCTFKADLSEATWKGVIFSNVTLKKGCEYSLESLACAEDTSGLVFEAQYGHWEALPNSEMAVLLNNDAQHLLLKKYRKLNKEKENNELFQKEMAELKNQQKTDKEISQKIIEKLQEKINHLKKQLEKKQEKAEPIARRFSL